MRYNQPYNNPDPNASYINGDRFQNIQGSTVPGAGVEYDQREIVHVIQTAYDRGYSDFANIPCGIPGNYDLTQLRKAIEGFIKGWSWIIDTTVIFHVHGTGADFVDLNAAMAYLRRFYITTNGHVILQMAGAPQGATQAARYVYTGTVIFSHYNNNRISVLGQRMLQPCPANDAYYASNGFGNRVGDTAYNLAMLRTKFATELYFTGSGPAPWPGLSNQGIIIWKAPMLMNFDGLLLTSDGSANGNGISHCATSGFSNTDTSMGIAAVGFSNSGFGFELGCASCYQALVRRIKH